MNIWVELGVILLLVLANGLFSLSEMAVVSVRRARLQQWATEGDRGAQAALALSDQPTRFLSTVQAGITLIGILTGAFGGARLAEALLPAAARLPMMAPYAEALSFGLVVVMISYLSLILGELVPKRLALANPERIASRVARPMAGLARLASPLVWVLSSSTEAVFRLLGVPPSTDLPVTEEEIAVLMEQGTEAGVFEAAEQDMVGRIFRLGDRRASSLMTPQRCIVWLDVEEPWESNRAKMAGCPHSRFLVCQGKVDHLLGIVLVKELLGAAGRGEPMELTSYLHQPLVVPESTRAFKLLELFKRSAIHVAVVVDEYGCVQGLVTLTDVLEAIVGDLPATNGRGNEGPVVREDGSWLLDGMLPIAELRDHFDMPPLPSEERESYQTVGGFIVTSLARIPAPTDVYEWEGWRFEVVDMDANRVDKVLLTPPTTAAVPEEAPTPTTSYADSETPLIPSK